MDGQTDGNDSATNRFSKFCESALKVAVSLNKIFVCITNTSILISAFRNIHSVRRRSNVYVSFNIFSLWGAARLFPTSWTSSSYQVVTLGLSLRRLVSPCELGLAEGKCSTNTQSSKYQVWLPLSNTSAYCTGNKVGESEVVVSKSV